MRTGLFGEGRTHETHDSRTSGHRRGADRGSIHTSTWSDHRIVSPGAGLVPSEVDFAQSCLWIGLTCYGQYVEEDARVYN